MGMVSVVRRVYVHARGHGQEKPAIVLTHSRAIPTVYVSTEYVNAMITLTAVRVWSAKRIFMEKIAIKNV
jgi:hypothetical protein